MEKTRFTDTKELKRQMLDKDYETIKALAEASGIDRMTLSKVLKGTIQPSADVMTKLVKTLDIPSEQAGRIFFNDDLRTA